jgi:hypothetical protein
MEDYSEVGHESLTTGLLEDASAFADECHPGQNGLQFRRLSCGACGCYFLYSMSSGDQSGRA